MKEICINQDWTFNEVVDNLKELKSVYWEDLALFSYFELKEKLKFERKTKDMFYKLKLQEWQIDKIWEYINGHERLSVLYQIARRYK